uniref:Uncharacterized protein n=1 Tax=Picea glauca TaxID=3330 RepID=A0A101M3Q3_PICGL|nr:hypothetical protein ABT39_MTgene200 [Picea glauca]
MSSLREKYSLKFDTVKVFWVGPIFLPLKACLYEGRVDPDLNQDHSGPCLTALFK